MFTTLDIINGVVSTILDIINSIVFTTLYIINRIVKIGVAIFLGFINQSSRKQRTDVEYIERDYYDRGKIVVHLAC